MPKQKRKELKKEIERLKEAIYHLVFPDEMPTKSMMIKLGWQKMFEFRKKLTEAIEADKIESVMHTQDIFANRMSRFQYSRQGHIEAVEYLQSIGFKQQHPIRWDLLIDKANQLFEQKMMESINAGDQELKKLEDEDAH